jgi:hypothetical protein
MYLNKKKYKGPKLFPDYVQKTKNISKLETPKVESSQSWPNSMS